MAEIFLKILNMSISASYIILAVLILRLLFKNSPKWITVALWGIVAVRLICPFSIESVFSLLPSPETVSPEIMMEVTPEINTSFPIINQEISPVIGGYFESELSTSINPIKMCVFIFSLIWVVGMAVLLIYILISYVRVNNKILTAVLLRDNIYQSENVISPFVFGIIKPKIYLPFNISEKDIELVVAHEVAHIRRKDHLWKPLGFLLLTLHWFNPLMWIGYIMLCRDIEFACDEKVVKKLNHIAMAEYSQALLNSSVNRRMIIACPLAFGEVGVKERVKAVLNYRKPAFWVVLVAVIACVIVSVCFLTDPVNENYGETNTENLTEEQISLMNTYPEFFGLDASDGLDVYVWQMSKNSYFFGLLPHSEEGRDWVSAELLKLRGTRAKEMYSILSSYNVDETDIYIIPWHNPLSSYLGEWQILRDGEDGDAKKQAYVEYIHQMLFGGDSVIEENVPDNDGESIHLIYAEPSLSWVTSYVPNVRIDGDQLYDENSEELLGNVLETELTSDIFDQIANKYQDEFKDLVQNIQQDNELFYVVEPVDSYGVGLYYVLLQNDGSRLLVYGHYEDGAKSDFIRWIFAIK